MTNNGDRLYVLFSYNSNTKLLCNHMCYNYHNYLFIPMVLYCLKKLYHAIMADTSIMDEALLTDEHMKSHTMRG